MDDGAMTIACLVAALVLVIWFEEIVEFFRRR
jgi:hypothetical protein